MFLLSAVAAALALAPVPTFATPFSLKRYNTATNESRTYRTGNVVRAPQPSDYPLEPGPYPNEFKYLNWDPTYAPDKANLERIHAAFAEFKAMAADALKKVQDGDQTMIKRWYGDSEPVSELEGVFANMYDKDTGQPTKMVSQMVCDREDFDNACNPNSNAYTRAETGKFHICPLGLLKKLNSEIECTDLDASCSQKMRSMPMFLLHEMTHYNEIGEKARGGFPIFDEANGRGAYDCFTLSSSEKSDNAQNYAWFAGEAYWSNSCQRTFEDPKQGAQ